MKVVTEAPGKEDIVVISLDEIKEFQRIGKLLARVADARLGTEDNKISVEADGWVRILTAHAFEFTVDMSSYPESIIEDINRLEPREEDGGDYEYEEEEETPEYSKPTEFKVGVVVVAAKNMTLADIYNEIGNDFVVVPAGTKGVIVEDSGTYGSRRWRVSFSEFTLPVIRVSYWRTSNDLQYKDEQISLYEYGCDCVICLKQHLESAKSYPLT